MPYIKQEFRKIYNKVLSELKEKIDTLGTNPGELNYLISSMCIMYLERKGESYTIHNDIIGVLESAKQEWYRRKVSRYEDTKIQNPENGDIF